MAVQVNLLKLLVAANQIRSFSEGRRAVVMGALSVRRRNFPGDTGLGEPEKIEEIGQPLEVNVGDVVLFGSKRTVVVTDELIENSLWD